MAPFGSSGMVSYSSSIAPVAVFRTVRDTPTYWSKIAQFSHPTPLYSAPPLGAKPSELSNDPRHWRSQGLEIGWAQEVCPQRGPGADGRSPQKPGMHIQSAGQTHFHDMFIEDIQCTFRLMRSLLPLHTPPKKLFESVQISRPTLAEVGWARAHPCPTVAMSLTSADEKLE